MKMLLFVSVALTVTLLAACGGDDDPDDARVGAVGDLSENVVDSWAANGIPGLYGFLHPEVTANCSLEGFEDAMEDQPEPTGWRNTRDIVVTDDVATATVIIVAGGQDIEQDWTFKLEQGARWRLTGVPGLQECTS